MHPTAKLLLWFVAWLAAAALPARADSLVTSSAAGGSSASSASSASLETSSDSSSPDGKAAEGPYRIIDVAAVPGQPGQLRLRMRALADTGARGELVLLLPQPAFERSGLAPGHTVAVRQRPYGIEFADARTQQPFFLVLADDWQRELPSRPVTL